MNIVVHLLIARSVRKIVHEQTGEKLSFTGFLYGNILPDISEKHGAAPHYFESSLEYVLENTAHLKKDMDSYSGTDSFALSKRAGVITHYLSDFFCYPHCESYNSGRIHHHIYELSMLFLFRRGFLFYQKQKKEQSVNFSELESFIVGNRKVYDRGENLKIRDVSYAITISAVVVSCLVMGKTCTKRTGLFPAYDMQSA
ncbi:hypothetical protein SDC9_136875 [bioreactor metagenome]|uniref:Phospholipase C/D domain-containing protein n=1 Tax=bioreactor metagenome TaxID=1076179 RepID=A0A645DLV3_9ZZZZ